MHSNIDHIDSPNDAVVLFREAIGFLENNEGIYLLPLKENGEILEKPFLIAKGTTMVSVKLGDILAEAYKLNAKAILVAHNHPSGNPKPSSADLEFTAALKDICKRLENIQFVDHIIIGSPDSAGGLGYVSIEESYDISV